MGKTRAKKKNRINSKIKLQQNRKTLLLYIAFLISIVHPSISESSDLLYFEFNSNEASRLSRIYKNFILKGMKIRADDAGLKETTTFNKDIQDWRYLKKKIQV